MYRANKPFGTACVVSLALMLGAESQAQTIGDYSRSQRAALEAEMNRHIAKALGTGGTASTSTAPSPPPVADKPPMAWPPQASTASNPEMPPTESGSDISVTGVIMLPKASWVEVNVRGESVLLLTGDKVPGTPWVVHSVRDDRVILKSGGQTRQIPFNAGKR